MNEWMNEAQSYRLLWDRLDDDNNKSAKAEQSLLLENGKKHSFAYVFIEGTQNFVQYRYLKV
jgi:hypothetical protein